MTAIPRAPGFDHTIALVHDPYRFISNMCRRLRSDIFMGRLLLTPTICLRGADGADLFYRSQRLIRHGAALRRIEKTLVGKGGVQGLDDEAHRHRKALFLAIISPEHISALTGLVDHALDGVTRRLAAGRTIVFYEVARELLMRTTCAWAGVPLPEREVAQRTREVAALFDYAGSIGPRHWWARWARRRCERWMRGLVGDVRSGRLRPAPDSALHQIAFHRDHLGQELAPEVAAVEMLNIIRPTVAVAVYLVQALHALHQNPSCGPLITAAGDAADAYPHWFVQEVRRWYPFFPAAVARVRETFTWHDHTFPAGHRVLLDLYGTNHDERIWGDPEAFRPERFRGWTDDGISLVAQGGGDRRFTHRCPGEPLAVALMTTTIKHFARTRTYRIPAQDLELDYQRLPALPRSRLIMTGTTPSA
jgi:fatty-acid peroxygenase